MSQQEFFPESQQQKEQPWSPEQTRYRRRESQVGAHEMPKSEHPSTFEEPVPRYSYPAQEPQPVFEEARSSQRERVRATPPPSQQQETRQQQWQVPWWARPQPQAMRGIPGWAIALAVILLLVPLIPFFISLIGILLTGLFILILIPLLLVGALLLGGIVLVVLFALGIIPRRRNRWGRWW